MKFSSTSAVLGFAAAAVAQDVLTNPSGPQATAISKGLISVAKSVTANPTLESLISVLSASYSTVTEVAAYESILMEYNQGPQGGINVDLLTSSISVPTQSWETILPSSLRSAFDSFETNFISDVQKVEATPLSITPGAPLPSSLMSVLSTPSVVLSSNSSIRSSVRPSHNTTSTSTSTASSSSSLGSTIASIASSAASSSSSSTSSSGAGPTQAAWNMGLGAAVGAVGMAAAML